MGQSTHLDATSFTNANYHADSIRDAQCNRVPHVDASAHGDRHARANADRLRDAYTNPKLDAEVAAYTHHLAARLADGYASARSRGRGCALLNPRQLYNSNGRRLFRS